MRNKYRYIYIDALIQVNVKLCYNTNLVIREGINPPDALSHPIKVPGSHALAFTTREIVAQQRSLTFLKFQPPRDEYVSELEAVSRRQFSVVDASSVVRVTVGN